MKRGWERAEDEFKRRVDISKATSYLSICNVCIRVYLFTRDDQDQDKVKLRGHTHTTPLPIQPLPPCHLK